MSQLQDFMYELKKYTTQAHTLKDSYNKLSEDDKKWIMEHAPNEKDSPDVTFEQTVDWVRALNEYVENST